MPKNIKKIMPINYTNREYETIRQDLMEIAERFYPDTFQDFSEASFGSMMLDAVAYVGDQLSFYLDYNVNESFLDTSYSLQNITRHGRILGYKDPGRPSTFGEVAVYVEIPADASGLGPDTRYMPILKRGTSFTSREGLNFILTENLDFSDPINPIVVSKVDPDTGAPTYYAIKAYGNVVSGKLNLQTITVGNYQRYLNLRIGADNISEIISVTDAEGNKYFEVQNLAQDIVYQEIPNNNYKNDNVPSVIKPLLVSRKYVVVRDVNGVSLQFGSGEESANTIIAEPQSVALDIFGKDYVTDTTFDPTRLSKNTNYGIVPANTDLTIAYRTTNPSNSNVAAASVNSVASALVDYKDREGLNTSIIQTIRASIEVTNEKPIVGDVTYPSSAEVKQRIFDTFPTQNRAVTQADYENLVYRMPAKFGSIKKCSVQKDPDSLKRNLNMYVISEDRFGKLAQTNITIKNNLKTWINEFRMVNDTIDILDPYIINLGIEFVISTMPSVDGEDVLNQSLAKLSQFYSDGFYIGEHLKISDIYRQLNEITDVLDVASVTVVNKTGAQYSNIQFNVNKNLSPDGGTVVCPKNAIFEIKFFATDMKGRIR
jgi:hypothetical protein